MNSHLPFLFMAVQDMVPAISIFSFLKLVNDSSNATVAIATSWVITSTYIES